MTTLYLSPFAEKQIEELQLSSRKGRLALEVYASICEVLQKGEDLFSKRTKHGENRISGCVKYDLGGGYRLVTIRRKGAVYLVCVGSHDEVDIWLERNRSWEPFSSSKVVAHVVETQHSTHELENEREHDLYEENLLERIDEDILRYVFAGLFTSKKEQAL